MKKNIKNLEEVKYDEGIELPKGYSSWKEVPKFSPVSSIEGKKILEILEKVEIGEEWGRNAASKFNLKM